MAQSRIKDSLYQIRPLRRAVQAGMLRGTPDCVFVWIPKTAGTSLYHWLRDNLGLHKMNIPRDYLAFPGFGAATFGHVHYLSLLHQGTVPRGFHDRAYRFAMVRDPYKRVASLYNYLRIDQGYEAEFPRFLEEVRLNRVPIGLYNHKGLSQTNPQVDWLLDWDGEFITQETFKVEEIDATLKSLCTRFSISAPPKMERRNVSQSFVSAGDFDRETLDKINEMYTRDFELLNYVKR